MLTYQLQRHAQSKSSRCWISWRLITKCIVLTFRGMHNISKKLNCKYQNPSCCCCCCCCCSITPIYPISKDMDSTIPRMNLIVCHTLFDLVFGSGFNWDPNILYNSCIYTCLFYIISLGAGGSPGTPAPWVFIYMKLLRGWCYASSGVGWGWGGVGWGW